MRHFIIELTYTVPFEDLADTLPAHRAFLQPAYDRELVLFSGPQLPKAGGVIVMRMESMDEVKAFFAHDPFHVRGLAAYRFIEIDMVKRQPFMDRWS